MKLTFDSSNRKDYIGSFLGEFKSEKLFKDISIKETLTYREKVESGEIIRLERGTRLDDFIFNEKVDFKNIREEKLFKLILKIVISKSDRYRDITKQDYDKVKAILERMVTPTKKKSKYVAEVDEYAGMADCFSDTLTLGSYINDFALMVIFAKIECFGNAKYHTKLETVLPENQRILIRNFYSEIANTTKEEDVKIVVKYGKKEALVIDTSVLIKMMLYEFAKEYFTKIEKLGKDTWEKEILSCGEDIRRGSKGEAYSEHLRALIYIYWHFVEQENIFKERTSNKKKYFLLGKLLEIAGHDKYNSGNDYSDEADFFHKRLIKHWKSSTTKKRTK